MEPTACLRPVVFLAPTRPRPCPPALPPRYISAGLNKVFDTFPCQVHFFTSPQPGVLYGKLNWRIVEPDGEFFTKNAVQRFVQDPKNPGILYNHDNECVPRPRPSPVPTLLSI